MQRIKKFISHPLLRHSAIVFAGSTGANIAAWLYHLFIGRILGTESYGELAALLSLFYIFNVPSSVLQTVLVKFFSVMKARNDYGQAKSLFILTTKKILIFEAIGLILIFPLSKLVSSFLNISSSINVIWLYLIFATFIISIANGSAMQGFQLFSAFSILTVIGTMLRLVFGIAFAFYGVGWTLISNIFSNIVGYILSFIPLRFLIKQKEEPITINRRDAFGFSIPAFFTTLGTTLLFSQDVLLVKHFFTSHEAGIYASLSVLGKVIFYASASISFVLFPILSERKETGKPHTHLVVIGMSLIGSMCLALTLLYFFFPQYVVLTFGKGFFGAAPYLGPFAIFISFFSLSSILINTLLALDKVYVWVFAILASFLQIVLINFFHDTIYQVINVNIAISVALFLSLLIYYVYEKT